MGEYLMGIDNGGTLTKAVIFDINGNEIAVSAMKPSLITPKPGYTVRDMDELWECNCACIKEAIETAGILPEDIIGIGCTGHGKGVYLWGYDGRPAFNGIISTDQRAYEYPEKWYKDGTYEKVYPKTMQEIIACQPVSLLAWIKDNHPDVIANTQYVFSVKDFIRYRLTGEAYWEITDFSGTNLMNLAEQRLDEDLLEYFGLPEIKDKIPPLKYSYENCGRITKETAQKTGLCEGTSVAGGMFDIDACAVAMDVLDEKDLCVIAGTWSINEYISREPVTNGSILMNSLFCIPDYFLIEESSPTSVGNSEWFINMFMGEEKRKASKDGKSIFEVTDEMVASVRPDEQNIIFLPFLFGSNEDFIAKASFIGLSSYHTKAQILRAVYEGIIFGHLSHINKLLLNRPSPKTIRLAGGAARSHVWVEIFADVLQLPVETVDVKELGALGSAMAASVAAGVYMDYKEAAKAMVKCGRIVLPNPDNANIYKRKYALYREMISALSPKWHLFS